MNIPAFSGFRQQRLVFHGLRKSAVNKIGAVRRSEIGP